MSIQTDIERLLVLQSEIAVRMDEVKAIKKRLEVAALKGPHLPLEDQSRQGKQYIAQGVSHRVPILITSDELVKSFQRDSALHRKILAALPPELVGEFGTFFQPSTAFETCFDNGKVFRAKAVEILGEKSAPKFITACVAVDKNGIAKNKIVIALDRAEKFNTEATEATE